MDTKKSEAQRLAECLKRDCRTNWPDYDNQMNAAHELERLQACMDSARLEISSLKAQLEAIGAGGVEPLRKRECLHQISEPASGEAERAAFVAYLTEKFPTVYSEGAAEHWWDKEHVSALAWQGRAALAAQAQPAAQALDAIVDLAQEAHRHWDADRDAKVGKLLMALSGYLPGYDKRADALHAAIAAQQGGANG